MFKELHIVCILGLMISACSPTATEKTGELTTDTTRPEVVIEKERNDSIETDQLRDVATNDTLNALANVIAGISDTGLIYQYIQNSTDFRAFSKNFNKRWNTFDSTRLMNLRKFRGDEIAKIVEKQSTLFYPFSGPDILHAQAFFPDADRYVLIGLEPVGSLPDFKKDGSDSLENYFEKVNTSLNAILKFSFFRTQSMKNDLKNEEVDGTLHLLVLFLKRTGNQLVSVKPVTVDSLGELKYVNSFPELKKLKSNTRGVEIKFIDNGIKLKTLCYFSVNAADAGLRSNKGFVSYLNKMGTINTYLKGASYLMHKNYFSTIRNVILDQSNHVIQDDSGIALHYFLEDDHQWQYAFFGQYLKPIPMFAAFYQKDLDSLYKHQGSKPIGFGIGYNFKDRNSNFMIATKVR
ncbi:MAG: hypothetical protein K0R26_1885 [Bacteroidota bacterium]|jgi:hypothetical protein|nr:hypothetical protein [Bacteroidota bacterium]